MTWAVRLADIMKAGSVAGSSNPLRNRWIRPPRRGRLARELPDACFVKNIPYANFTLFRVGVETCRVRCQVFRRGETV